MSRARLVTVVVVWWGLWLVLLASDARPDVVLLGGVVAVSAAGILATLDATRVVDHLEWTRPPERRPEPSDDPRVARLRHQVSGARWQQSRELTDALVALVDDRLQQRHGIDRAADPVAADAVLTPALRRLVADDGRTLPGIRELRRILTDLEAR